MNLVNFDSLTCHYVMKCEACEKFKSLKTTAEKIITQLIIM